MMTKKSQYQIVVISPEGKILDVEIYNPAPANRLNAIAEAVRTLEARTGLHAPAIHANLETFDGVGNSWGKMSGDILPGMVEIGFGVWGFES